MRVATPATVSLRGEEAGAAPETMAARAAVDGPMAAEEAVLAVKKGQASTVPLTALGATEAVEASR